MLRKPAIKLSDLSRLIQRTFELEFENKSFWIFADVTNHTFKANTNQHYFELVEKDRNSSNIIAKLAGRAWGASAIKIKNFEEVTGQLFKDNISVLVNVTVHHHILYGLQLQLIDIDPNFTLGQFEQQRHATLERLIKENPLFIERFGNQFLTKNNKLIANKVMQKLAVISSETSAGYEDFVHTLLNNNFGFKFHVSSYFTKVQGEGNAKSIVEKLIDIYYKKDHYDAVIIIRGGGSQSDFLIFDNYELSRAVARFPIPVITGIGHLKNETVVDLMAHTATKTPTKAAEHIIAHNKMFEEGLFVLRQIVIMRSQQMLSLNFRDLGHLKSGMINNVLQLVKQHQYQISALCGVFVNRPKMQIGNQRKELVQIFINVSSNRREFLKRKMTELSHFGTVIRMMSPKNILNKGFAILHLNGKIISTGAVVKEEDELTVELLDTKIKTVVRSKIKNDGNEYDI